MLVVKFVRRILRKLMFFVLGFIGATFLELACLFSDDEIQVVYKSSVDELVHRMESAEAECDALRAEVEGLRPIPHDTVTVTTVVRQRNTQILPFS